MLKALLYLLLALVVVLALLAGLAMLSPLSAARLIYPTVETFMLREPFRGVTSDGTVREGLFAIQSTGVSTAPVRAAAQEFIESLDTEQRQQLMFAVDDSEWRRWANIHISIRQGVGFLDMTPPQRDAAFALLAASLSARGLQTSRDIMRLEGHLADLKDNHTEYGEQRYWLTVMGTPSPTEPWGWQLDGHHLVINYFVLGNQVVMTPTFMGSEPPQAVDGPYAGTSILDAELEAGLALVNALNADQRRSAILSQDKSGNNNMGELFRDNVVVPYRGIRMPQLSPAQQSLARALVKLYIGNLPAGHAAVRMREIEAHWAETSFAWVGATSDDAVFYYRLHSPVVMIEYDHQVPVGLEGPDRPTRNHVHTVVRTPNGNDYGKDLLAQHLRRSH